MIDFTQTPTFNSDPAGALDLPPFVPGHTHVLPRVPDLDVPQPQPGHSLPERREDPLLPPHVQLPPVPHPLEGGLRVPGDHALKKQLVACVTS